uniref:Ras-associating domain-containing protein n=1 Tax=Xiphophorus couchianus TaxID=32473 RepID=A0A3B5M2Z7_9TELE
MELKVWVDGVQRIVCGVTEFTTCQEVVIALAQAIGRTGRYTLIEKWRDTERHLAPHENPVVSLNKWGQYASDVQLILQRTGPSVSERPTSEGLARVPERGLYRQSLPPLAKLRPAGTDGSLKRREPKRKSLTFTGGHVLSFINVRRKAFLRMFLSASFLLAAANLKLGSSQPVCDLQNVSGFPPLSYFSGFFFETVSRQIFYTWQDLVVKASTFSFHVKKPQHLSPVCLSRVAVLVLKTFLQV